MFEVEAQANQMAVTLKLKGSLTIESADRFTAKWQEYLATGHKSFLLDSAELEFIDSSGLGAIVALSKQARQAGGGIALYQVPEAIRSILELTRLDLVLPLAADRVAAEARLFPESG